MLRVKLVIEYDGSNYVGWQRQDKGKSVQGEIEKSLKLGEFSVNPLKHCHHKHKNIEVEDFFDI